MSQRAHFWIRIFGLAIILAAEFGPRWVTGSPGSTPPAIATVVGSR